MSAHLDQTGKPLQETSATDILLTTAAPTVLYEAFTQRREAENGADWLWWWVDRDQATCFGLLVQAKVLKLNGRRWEMGLRYRTEKHEALQIDKLLHSADQYDVPAAYLLYCGDPEYRATLECGMSHGPGGPCRDNARAGVSCVAALAAHNAVQFYGNSFATKVFHDSIPVEDIAAPPSEDTVVLPPVTVARVMSTELTQFLTERQAGARRVAKELLRPVQKIRNTQFAAGLLERANLTAQPLFPHVPEDRGHFPVPYLTHILRGLRTSVPDYVLDVMDGRTPPQKVAMGLGGIVVVTNADRVR